MKKFLSLVLALVMTMSLVTISAGAKDFTDNSKITYKEAVDVMTAVKVVDGYADGSFNPTAGLTRGAAAKIICNMILGPTTASALNADAAPYKDVPVDSTFAGYIAFCAKEGIISGYADGTFRPAAPLTGYAFMKMLLGALGYDAVIEGYTGANWSINVAKRALNIELDKGLEGDFVGSKALTREEACLYAFNALQSKMVEYENNTSITIGDVVINTGSKAEEVKEYDDFAAKYFKDLKKVDPAADDAFGRPAHKWFNDKTKRSDKYLIGTYADEADYVVVLDENYDAQDFATNDKISDELADLTDNDDLAVSNATKLFFNGTETTTLAAYNAGAATKGAVLELFCDDNAVERVVAYTYTPAQVSEINLDDDDEIESVVIDLLKSDTTVTIDVEDDEDAYAKIADLEEDDVFVAVWKASQNDVDDALLLVDEVETVEGTVGSKSADWVKVDGTKYTKSGEYSGAAIAVEDEGSFFLYNDYLVHADTSSDADDEYLYVVRAGEESDKWGGKTIYAEVVFVDGTSKTVEVEKVGGKTATKAGTVAGAYSFKYDEDDDTYELTAVDTSKGALNITKGKTAVATGVTANSKTVYVKITLDDGAFDESKVYTGYKSVSTIAGAEGYVVEDKGVAEVVFILAGTAKNDSDDMIYVATASGSSVIEDKDLGDYYTYNAVVDGKIVEIMTADVVSDALFTDSTTNDDGVYTAMTPATINDDYKIISATQSKTVNFKKAADDVVTVEAVESNTTTKTVLAYADDVVVFVIDDEGAITTGSISRNYSDVASVTYVQNDDDEVTALYIVKK